MWSSRVRRTFVAVNVLLVLVSAAGAARQAPAVPVSDSAPQQEWLTDAAGRQYREEPLPRAQGQKIDETAIRTIWGVKADLAREDAEFFYIKLYRVVPVAPPAAPAPPPAAPLDEPLPIVASRLRLEPMATGLPTVGQWREGIVVADVIGDGRKEIIAGPARKTLRQPTVFGWDGTTWARQPVTFPQRFYDYGDLAVTSGADGAPILAMGIHLRGLAALRLAEPGRFEDRSGGLPLATRGDQAAFSSRGVVLADCNGDRRPDLIAIGEGPRLGGVTTGPAAASGIAAYPAQADGTWGEPIMSEADLFGGSLSIGDVDGDGRIDVAIAPARLEEGRIVLRGEGGCRWTPETVPQRPRAYVTAVALTPASKQARSALVVASTSFAGAAPVLHLDVMRRDAKGAWTVQALMRIPARHRIQALGTGDLDGDGAPEIVAVGLNGEATIFSGSRSGTFVRESQTLPSADRCEGAAVVIDDLDGDKRNDLLISYAQEESAQAPGVCPGEGAIRAWRVSGAPAAPRAPARD